MPTDGPALAVAAAPDADRAPAARVGLRMGLLLGLPAAAVAGAALQLQQPLLWPLAAYAGLAAGALLLAVLAWWLRLAGGAAAAAWALVAGLAVFAATGGRAVDQASQALDPALEGRDLQLTVRITAMPQWTERGVRLRLAVLQAQSAEGAAVAVPPLIELAWYGAGPDQRLQAGQTWVLTARLRAPHGERNPHGFDYELWLWEQGVQALGYVRDGLRNGARDAPPRWLADSWAHPVERLRQAVRDHLRARALQAQARMAGGGWAAAPERAWGVVAALVVGDQRAIARGDWELFRTTGIAHLVSISGLHITMFSWLAVAAVGWAWRRSARLCAWWPAPVAAGWAGVALAAAYALFSGWGLPAQRTVLMLALVTGLRLAGRPWPWPQVWLLALAVLVVVDPWALLQAGFWLSFVAVGLLFATDTRAFESANTGTRGYFYRLLREQAVVTLALTPLGLLWFGQISLVGLLANLVAIPWVTLLVTPLALLGLVWAPLWEGAAWAVQALVAGLQVLAQWPAAVLYLAAAPLWAGVAATLGGLWLAMPWPLAWRLLGLPLLLPALAWQPPRPPPGEVRLWALDVGQGAAVLVQTAQHSLLYDAGPRYSGASSGSDAGQRVVVPLLRAWGERLDALMLSHQDADHMGGAAAVLAQQPQARLWGAGGAALAQALGPAGQRLQACTAGQRWQWDGVDFAVLHPDAALAQVGGNAGSCVLRIGTAAGRAALLPGDIGLAQEQALLLQGAPLAADWLLVPHHGSKTSSGAAWLEAVAPRTAVVQAGYRNRFGHPAPEVLQRYAAVGATVVQTSRCGALRWASWQAEAPWCERQQRPRYWQFGQHGPARPAPQPPAPAAAPWAAAQPGGDTAGGMAAIPPIAPDTGTWIASDR